MRALLTRLRILIPGVFAMAVAAGLYAYPWPSPGLVWASIMAGPLAPLVGITIFDSAKPLIPVLLAAFFAVGVVLDPIKQEKWSGFTSALALFMWFFTGLLITIYYRS